MIVTVKRKPDRNVGDEGMVMPFEAPMIGVDYRRESFDHEPMLRITLFDKNQQIVTKNGIVQQYEFPARNHVIFVSTENLKHG